MMSEVQRKVWSCCITHCHYTT